MAQPFKTYIPAIVLFVGVAILGIYLFTQLSHPIKTEIGNGKETVSVTPTQKPMFSLAEKEFDFGKIKQSGGKVEHRFVLTYNGEKPVKITGTPTSCACTQAKIDKTTLSKGESATLTVAFDPNLHEEPTGKFFKTISVLTEPSIGEPPEIKIWTEIDLDLGKDAYKLKAAHDDEHNESQEKHTP